MIPTENPDVAEELKAFDAEDIALCLSYYEAYLEEAIEPGLASRNAVALVMQKKRMSKPQPTPKQYREMMFWYSTFLNTKSEEEADQMAWKRIMKDAK